MFNNKKCVGIREMSVLERLNIDVILSLSLFTITILRCTMYGGIFMFVDVCLK